MKTSSSNVKDFNIINLFYSISLINANLSSIGPGETLSIGGNFERILYSQIKTSQVLASKHYDRTRPLDKYILTKKLNLF